MKRALPVLASLALASCVCGQFDEAYDRLEAALDAGTTETGAPDAGSTDAGAPDAAVADAGPADAGAPDAGPADTDAGPPDAGHADAGPPDAGVPDAGAPAADAGLVDAGPPACSMEQGTACPCCPGVGLCCGTLEGREQCVVEGVGSFCIM